MLAGYLDSERSHFKKELSYLYDCFSASVSNKYAHYHSFTRVKNKIRISIIVKL